MDSFKAMEPYGCSVVIRGAYRQGVMDKRRGALDNPYRIRQEMALYCAWAAGYNDESSRQQNKLGFNSAR